jgi:hypothetical protein
MSLYTHPENLRIIWKALQSFPLFNELFNDPRSKEIWFQDIINQFNNTVSINLSSKSLNELNHKTVKFMVEYLKKNEFNYRNNNQIRNNQGLNPLPAREKTMMVGSEMDSLFVQRQKEYTNMLAEHVPKQIDFTMGENDEPLTNINELLEKHKSDRESVLSYDHNIMNNTPPTHQKIKIYENNTSDNTIEDVVEFFSNEPPNSIDKKRVNWNDTSSFEKRFLLLEEKITLIDKRLLVFESRTVEKEIIIDQEENYLTNNFNKKSYL